MTDLEVVKKVFPHLPVEQEGEDITIDKFLTVSPAVIEVDSLLGKKKVPGYVLNLDSGEDVYELVSDRQLDIVLIHAAEFHGGWSAREKLNAINTEEFAAELRQQGLIE